MSDNSTDTTKAYILFEWYDHVIFGIMLSLSTAIGIYFSCTGGKKKDTTDEYFMGGKKMSVFPIAMSLVASHVSSVSLMTVPADVYSYGAMYWLSCISIFFCAFATSYVFLPVFYELQLDSTYEYLSKRFDASICMLCSSMFVINVLLFMGIVVYVPAMAYSQATGISVYIIIPIICTICTFYTTIGGLKTVVWTDTLQFSVTCGAILIVFVLGTIRAGGMLQVFDTAMKGDRLYFDLGFDPTQRETVFAVIMHWFLTYTRMLSTSQECILKFLSLPTLKKAQQSIFIFCFGIIIVKSIIVITGLIMFAIYHDCDPLTLGVVEESDQMIPFYVANVASGIPGLTGLFICGVYCTALSTLSAIMNALSATIYQDFIRKCMPQWTDNEKTPYVTKSLVVIMGVLIAGIALIVKQLGPIFPLAISVASVTAGSFLGLFTLGMLCPRATTKGVFSGVVSSTLIVGWITIGAQWYKVWYKDLLILKPTHFSTDHCEGRSYANGSIASNSTIAAELPEIWYGYRISHYWYALIGFVICMVVGMIVSYFTKDEKKIDKKLISPLVHFLIKDDKRFTDEYYSINRANMLVAMNMKEVLEKRQGKE